MADLSVLLVMHELTMAGASRLAIAEAMRGQARSRLIQSVPSATEAAELGRGM